MSFSYEFEAIGTHWQIDVYEDISAEKEAEVKNLIATRIEEFDKNYSRFREDSLVTKMSKVIGDYVLPTDAEPMMDLYQTLYKLTEGLVTPLIGQALVDAGYDANYSLEKKELQTPPKWEEVLEYKFPNLKIKTPTLLDFGAAGKGYLIDIAASLLESVGIQKYCVDAGGDMIYRGASPLRVGLENPNNTEQVIGVVNLQNKSLCGSAGNRRKWADMHHIVNPAELSSPKNILAIWVLADSTFVADGLTTALFFVPASKLMNDFNFDYLILKDDFSIEKSTGFEAEIFKA